MNPDGFIHAGSRFDFLSDQVTVSGNSFNKDEAVSPDSFAFLFCAGLLCQSRRFFFSVKWNCMKQMELNYILYCDVDYCYYFVIYEELTLCFKVQLNYKLP